MTAAYPGAIKSFFYRQDFTEIVDAADINTAYDEIVAIQNTLGTSPQSDTIDSKLVTWPTVKANIAASRKRVTDPYVYASAHNFSVPYNNSNYSPSWTSVGPDTHGMFTGSNQLTCVRSGIYTFDIYVRWHLDNLPGPNQQTPLNRSGILQIDITNLGTGADIVAHGGYFAQGFQQSIHQSASITAPWIQGQTAIMRLTQTCMTGGMPATTICAITYQRDPQTVNNM